MSYLSDFHLNTLTFFKKIISLMDGEKQYDHIHSREHDRDKKNLFGLRLQSSSWTKCSLIGSKFRTVALTFRYEFLRF